MVSERESSVAKNEVLRPSTWKETTLLSETIMGLTFKLCGAIGVITKLADVGYKMGPPQLKLYPVEPVGVEIIKPSAQ
jgi:predicted DNA repair protein MutK